MNTKKLAAAALRGRALYLTSSVEGLSEAIDPSSFEEVVLKLALGTYDSKGFLLGLADYFDPPAVGAAVSEPLAAVAATPAAQEAPTPVEPVIRLLDGDETVMAGDEWRLRDGLRHRDGRPVEWRPVVGSVGSPAGDFPDSIFRRKIG